jgi:hypothetical protein
LHYRYLYAALGTLAEYTASITGLVTNTILIINAMLTNDAITAAAVMDLQSVSAPGPLADPAGNMYYGVDIFLAVTELIN